MTDEPAKVLTVAGSDSGGAAGLQADLKTLTALGVYGMSVVTAVTAQNSVEVRAVEHLAVEFVLAQLDAVLEDYGAAAVKTGFLGRADLIAALAGRLADQRPDKLVIDPVLVNHRGRAMFSGEVTRAYLAHLLPLAALLTPNRYEAALLTDRAVETTAEAEAAGRQLCRQGAGAVLVTGIPDGSWVVDVLVTVESQTHWRQRRLETENTHGSGDTLSAAAAAFLARGLPLSESLERARSFTRRALLAAADWQLGQGHGPLAQWLAPDVDEPS